MKEKTVGAPEGWQRFKSCSQKHIVVDDYCCALLQPSGGVATQRERRAQQKVSNASAILSKESYF